MVDKAPLLTSVQTTRMHVSTVDIIQATVRIDSMEQYQINIDQMWHDQLTAFSSLHCCEESSVLIRSNLIIN